MDIEASADNISDGFLVTSKPPDLLVWLLLVCPDNSSISTVLVVGSSNLDRDNLLSISGRSDGLGSPVKDPPLLVVLWIVVLDS